MALPVTAGDSGSLGKPPNPTLLSPFAVYRHSPTVPDTRHVRSAATHVAGRAPEHVRGEAGPRERWPLEVGPRFTRRACAPLGAQLLQFLLTPTPAARCTRPLDIALPEPASALLIPPRQVRGQKPRDLPLVARDFPQHGALERARDCAQALLPSATGARASLRKQA